MNIAITPSGNSDIERIAASLKLAAPEIALLPWKSGDPAPASTIDVLLTMGSVTREDMQALPGLQCVQTMMDGYEVVDVEAATEMGIWVSYAPAEATGNGDSVAEFAILLLLAAARRLGQVQAFMHGVQPGKPQDATSLVDKTICIVGVGGIGLKVAQRLIAFGARVIGVDRTPVNAPPTIPTRSLDRIDEALAEADFVLLSVRATNQNKHLINADRLRAMKTGAILVNVARGSLIDEHALLDVVRTKHLAGAALDVVESEPLSPENPLLSLPQIFVTPHVAGATDLTSEGTAKYLAYALGEFGKGRHIDSILNNPHLPRRPLTVD